MVNFFKEKYKIDEPTTLLLCGGVFLNIMFDTNELPEYLFLTELHSESATEFEVGIIDYKRVDQLYNLIFTSQDFINEHGTWRFLIYFKAN